MTLLLLSFIAGILTVLAPCVLPLLPIIIGGSSQGTGKRNPYIITASLAVAVVAFTLLLKFSTLFINIPASLWNTVSGVIIISFGLISVFPELWEWVSIRFGLSNRSEQLLAASARTPSRWSDVLIGLSLGPVFSSCSPTYFLILATVLPRSLLVGTIYLIAYAIGLSLVLLAISLLGQRFIRNAAWAANPRGWFKRGLGILFILVGIFIMSGADKSFQTYVLARSPFNITNLEQHLLQKALPKSNTTTANPSVKQHLPRYHEIENASGFVNATSVHLKELIGKKIILLDFMTYSCINCIRTFPFLNAWYDKYKDQGLEIIGIHTPEFAFEKKLSNVETAMKRFGITFPIVLDNDYGTWNAYGNSYWPRKYLIDLEGNIVYDHIGEGKYDETEKKIQELLRTMPVSMGTPSHSGLVKIVTAQTDAQSPETYFGASRNEYLANGRVGSRGMQYFVAKAPYPPNRLVLDGKWDIQPERAVSQGTPAGIIYHYLAKSVFLVAHSPQETLAKVTLDGHPIPKGKNGSDIVYIGEESFLQMQEERLYSLIDAQDTEQGAEEHVLRIDLSSPSLEAYAFTFG